MSHRTTKSTLNPRKTTWTACWLDAKQCLSLHQVLSSLSTPISEAWAFAIIYESCKTFKHVITNKGLRGRLVMVQSTKELFIHKDGYVHQASFLESTDRGRAPVTCESKALTELGKVIYTALDYGLGQNEERTMSNDLHSVLEVILANGPESPNRPGEAAQRIMHVCSEKISIPNKSGTHFRAVCRAMVAELLELSSFLDKVTQSNEEKAQEFKELDMKDWAQIWVSCMRELRDGVKLKKVNVTKAPVEYELTPYEMLMDDIRSKRYSLNKVMVNGEVPIKPKNNAHDVIMEFIRSRPPLRPANERVLRPAVKNLTPGEKLMESIRNSNLRSSLRKTSGPIVKQGFFRAEHSRTSVEDNHEQEKPKKKLLKIFDEEKLLNFDDDSDSWTTSSSDEDENENSIKTKHLLKKDKKQSLSRVAKDLAMHGAPLKKPGLGSRGRRHSVTICETPKMNSQTSGRHRNDGKTIASTNSNSGASSIMTSSSSGRTTPESIISHHSTQNSDMHLNLQKEFLRSLEPLDTVKEEFEEDHIDERHCHNQFEISPDIRPVTDEPNEGHVSKFDKIVFSDETENGRIFGQLKLASENEMKRSEFTNTLDYGEFIHKKLLILDRQKMRYFPMCLDNVLSMMTPRCEPGPRAYKKLSEGRILNQSDSENWSNALKTLDLTLDEVIHIRSVLTKAELENLPLDGCLRDDLEHKRICFLCMKTKFGLFSWGVQCQLCKQQVCAKCSAKLRIPTDAFANVPMTALSGHLTGSNRESTKTSRASLKNSAGSAPSSPEMARKSVKNKIVQSGPESLPIVPKIHKKESVVEQVSGNELQVCSDCKEMVLQVIRNQRLFRKIRLSQEFSGRNSISKVEDTVTKEEVFS